MPVYELDCATVRGDDRVGSDLPRSQARVRTESLKFGPMEFFDAMARSRLISDPTLTERVFGSLVQAHDFRQVLVRTSQGHLAFNAHGRANYRDDERTILAKRIGSALTYLVGMHILGFRHIIDFGRACRDHYGVSTLAHNASRPDYIGSADGFSAGQILESKGSLLPSGAAPNWKTDLKDALNRQVDSGLALLRGTSVQRGWAVTAVLREANSGDESAVAFADPTRRDLGGSPPPSRRRRMVDLHYAVWAASAGLHPLAQLLVGGRGTHQVVVRGDVANWSGRRWFVPTKQAWGPDNRLWGRGLEMELAERLATDRDLFVNYMWPKALNPNNLIMPDATAWVPIPYSEPHGHRELTFRR